MPSRRKSRPRARAGFEAKFPRDLTPTLQYRAWRTQLGEAAAILERVYEELDDWMQDRSERWHESDRAGELEAEKDELEVICDTLSGLNVLKLNRCHRPVEGY